MSRYTALQVEADERRELEDARRLIGQYRGTGTVSTHALSQILNHIMITGWPRGVTGEGRITPAEAAAYLRAVVNPNPPNPDLNPRYLAAFQRGFERLGIDAGRLLSEAEHGVRSELTDILERMEARAAAGQDVRDMTEQYIATAAIRDGLGITTPEDMENRFQAVQRRGFANEINTTTTEAERLMALSNPTAADRTRMAELFAELNEWRTANPGAFSDARITSAQFNELGQLAARHHLEQLRAQHEQGRPGGETWRALRQAAEAIGGPRTIGLTDLSYDVLGRRELRLQEEDLRTRLEQLERQPPDPNPEVRQASLEDPQRPPQRTAGVAAPVA